MRSKKGFTLIELLVVISIIALLLSILMPGLRKAKEIARKITCRTNIRSLVLGYKLYVDSNDQKGFVYGELDRHGNRVRHSLWLRHIEVQTGEIDKVRYCPSTKVPPESDAPYGWPDCIGDSRTSWAWPFHLDDPSSATPDTAEFSSYGYNTWLYSKKPYYADQADWDQYAFGTPHAPNAGNIPIFADNKWVEITIKNGQDWTAGIDYDKGGPIHHITALLMNRHGKEINVGFLDGHVESVPFEKLWSLKWGKNYETQSIMTRPD